MNRLIPLWLLTCACACTAEVIPGTTVFTDRSDYTTEEHAWVSWPAAVGVEFAGKQQAKVWCDAVQFEAGTEPTNYEP